ncbi:hypothetical protein ACIQUQ_30300 [Streptomyces sp. NPDC101118]|uniref:hypothetical protein n=1 Tax=Streptomyces sp. NPDC101118 TaxID=3366109 RepID=UPI0037F1749A
MRKIIGRCAVVAAMAIAVTGCQDTAGGKATRENVRPSGAASASASPSGALRAVQAAWTATKKADSARVRLTMTTNGMLGTGRMEMHGVQGWADVPTLDVTMRTSGSLKAKSTTMDLPDEQRIIMVGTRQYFDLGPELAKKMSGKRWVLLPAKQASGQAGVSGLGNDPAVQLAVLLQSKNVKHLGRETVDGTATEHYKGMVSMEEMAAVSPKAAAMSPEERKRLLEAARAARIEGYDTDVWLNASGYPVRMKVLIATPVGALTLDAHYSDFGKPAPVTEPMPGEVFDPTAQG